MAVSTISDRVHAYEIIYKWLKFRVCYFNIW
jgi:hypothetical protein